jgi:hypothetical protein
MRELANALGAHGLMLRGGFHPVAGEEGLDGVGTLVLVGNAGDAMWRAFAPRSHGGGDALDYWTRSVVEPIAALFSARALYPFGIPRRPFQQWAQRADAVYRSPLGILIHPEYGLWHAYRAAFAFGERLPLPKRMEAANPCDACAERPCLRACPVGAFDGAEYDVAACASHLAVRDAGGVATAACHGAGCLARKACPVGAAWRYPEPMTRFHMAAYARSVAAS